MQGSLARWSSGPRASDVERIRAWVHKTTFAGCAHHLMQGMLGVVTALLVAASSQAQIIPEEDGSFSQVPPGKACNKQQGRTRGRSQ